MTDEVANGTGTIKQEIAGIRGDVHELRVEVGELRTLVTAKQTEFVSINDPTSIRPFERGITKFASACISHGPIAGANAETFSGTLSGACSSDAFVVIVQS